MKHVARITIALVEHYYSFFHGSSSDTCDIRLSSSGHMPVRRFGSMSMCSRPVASQLYYRELLHLCVSRFFRGVLSGKISSVPVSLLLIIFCKIVSNSREQFGYIQKGNLTPV